MFLIQTGDEYGKKNVNPKHYLIETESKEEKYLSGGKVKHDYEDDQFQFESYEQSLPEDHMDYQSGFDVILDDDGLESPTLFEGDIANYSTNPDDKHMWTNGVVPYKLSGDFSKKDVDIIMQAFQVIQDKTCIRFKQCELQKIKEQNYVNILKGDDCWSSIGMLGGRQDISLAKKCIYLGGVLHELMHTLGFIHEQSRLDRDDYISINWNNVGYDFQDNFAKYSSQDSDHAGAEYDLCSIMHFGPTVFAKDESSPTIDVKRTDLMEDLGCELGQRESLSDTDIRKINTMYKCRGFPMVSSYKDAIEKSNSSSSLYQTTIKPKKRKSKTLHFKN